VTTVQVGAPAPAPCGSCPYRRDVPSGVWERDEYEKLVDYDEPTYAQPISVFLCHQQDGRVCAGWCGTHDMENTLAVRLAAASGRVTPDTFDAILAYETAVPLFASGREAHDHGVADLDEPRRDAVRTIQKLERRRARR
jgi:hypothetical protein